MARTTDAIKILRRHAGDAELMNALEKARMNAEVAQLIYAARTESGLTQLELAVRVGTTQSAIARLEDADYDGHSLNMLQRVAGALGKRLEIKMATIEA